MDNYILRNAIHGNVWLSDRVLTEGIYANE